MSSLKVIKSGRVSSTSLPPSEDGYWRSFAELEDSPEFREFLEREFPEQQEELKDPLSRRRFMQLMGASFALAGVGACRWEEENIMPLSRRPDGYIPGVAKHYATAFELGGVANGLLVTCMDGRPIKIEGNPDHPFCGGASSQLGQASILELYDPDRSKGIRRQKDGQAIPATREDALKALKALRDQFKAAGGAGFRVLSEATSSPTIKALRDELAAAMPSMKWHEYEPLSRDNMIAGNKQAFGSALRTHYRLDRAKVVATFDAELFGENPAGLRHARDFGAGRDPEKGEILRLYSVESAFTQTGSTADHRLPVRSELIKPILLGLEALVASGNLASVGSAIFEDAKVKQFLEAMAGDLAANRGRSIVAVGANQPAEVHAIAARLNSKLANAQRTVFYTSESEQGRPSHLEDLKGLVGDMSAGKVSGLLIIGGNPVYNAPADLDFAGALKKVGNSIHLSMYQDETSVASNWHINRAHYLEAWGDSASYDGTVTVMQPMIEPLYQGMSPVELLQILGGAAEVSGEAAVKKVFKGSTGGSDAQWREALHNGFVAGSAPQPVNVQVKGFQPTPLTETQKLGTRIPNGKIELTFQRSATYDGRYANNSWLLEIPDGITKLTWDNAAMLSPATAKDLGISNGDVINITVGDKSMEIVATVTPGQAPYSIALPLGWGRHRAGRVGGHDEHKVKPVGFDTYAIRSSAGFFAASGATVKKTGKTHELAHTQDHFAMDSMGADEIQRRANIQIKNATQAEYKAKGSEIVTKDAHMAQDHALTKPTNEKNFSLHDEWKYEGRRWGMTIDLGKCTGCNTCIVACQAENNIPVVGKKEVINNREMHWIRIDRYFKGNANSPEMAYQPVHCQQCENAPCEVVCPAGATIHSEEGLNDMAYNRCVGTRYCANNCPYKVRRFNYLHFNKEFDEARNKVRKLLFNPDVTVRSRGVMEKCTWCVQRIERVKIDAKNNRRPIEDGEIQTACQQACPTGAITFGDLNQENSVVSKQHSLPRSYALLAGLNNKPRNAYLARITNPNPKLVTKKQDTSHE